MTFWTYNARHKVFAPYQMSFSPMFMFLVLSWIIGFGPALRIDGRWGQMGWKGTDARSPLLLQFSLRVRLRVWASLCHINRLLTSVCTYSNSSNRSLCMRLPAVGSRCGRNRCRRKETVQSSQLLSQNFLCSWQPAKHVYGHTRALSMRASWVCALSRRV